MVILQYMTCAAHRWRRALQLLPRVTALAPLLLASGLFATPPLSVTDFAEVFARGESAAAQAVMSMNADEITALAQALSEGAFSGSLVPESAHAARRGLHFLIANRNPLPNGAPAGVFDVIETSLRSVPDEPRATALARHRLASEYARLAARADGPTRVKARLAQLGASVGDAYASSVLESVLRSLRPARTVDAPLDADAAHTARDDWDVPQLIEVLEAVADREIRSFATRDASAFPASPNDRLQSITGAFALVALEGNADHGLRIAAADSLVRLREAQISWGARLGLDGRVFAQFNAATPVLAALSGSASRSDLFAGSAEFCDGIQRLLAVRDESIRVDLIARLIRVMDWLPNELIPPGNQWPRPLVASELDALKSIFDTLAALVTRVASLPTDHAAWSAENRCLWIATVDGDRSTLADGLCDSLKRAWIDSRTLIPAAWREECTKAAQEKAAAEAEAKSHAPTASTSPAAPHKED